MIQKRFGKHYEILFAVLLIIFNTTIVLAWNVSSAVYMTNVSIATQDTAPLGLFFKPDGTRMYITGNTGDRVYQYNLSDAWNVSSAVYESNNISIAPQDNTPGGLFFKADGTKMYHVGASNDQVYQYNLSDAWNVSSAIHENNISIGAQDSTSVSVFFKPDGTKMYLGGDSTDRAYQYNLSDSWNVSSAVYDNVFFSIQLTDNILRGLFFKPDGTKMYIAGNQNDRVYQYNLSDAWDISSAVYNDNISVTTEDTVPYALFFKSDGTRMYITGNTNDNVYQYSLPSSDSTAPAISIIYPTNNTFSNINTLNVNYTASDETEISSCWYSNDTMSFNTTLTNCGTNITTITWSEGQHNVTIWANDTSNNTNSISVRFTIDTIKPNITINSPLNQTYNANSILFNITAVDNTGISTCSYTLNNGVVNYTMSNSTANVWNATNSTMSQGSHTARFYCNDTSGNLNNSETITFVADVPPSISIITPSNNTRTIDNLTDVNYTASESTGISSCWYSNDTMTLNITLTNCANITLVVWSTGQHNVTIWANDTTNSVNSASVTFRVYNNTCDYALDGKPFITSVTNQSVLIGMLFNEDVDYLISYGNATGNYQYNSSVVTNNPINTSAEVYLTNLTPDSTWFYRPYIRKNGTSESYCAVFTERNFTTQKPSGASFVFDVIADSHWYKALINSENAGLLDFNKTTNLMVSDNPDFVIDGGDTAMTHIGTTAVSTQGDADNRYHLTRNEYASRIPFPIYYGLGNHETEFDFNGTAGHTNLAMNLSISARLRFWPGPTNNTYSYGGSNDTYNGEVLESYFAFDHGDATFIVLDVMRYNSQPGPQNPNQWTYGKNQFEWLNRTLATSTKKWKFVFAHHIAGGGSAQYGFGYAYGDGGGNYSQTGNESYGQVALNPLMERYNAQFFVYGHSHFFNLDWANWSSYNRTKSVNYVLTSTASQAPNASSTRNGFYDGEMYLRGHTKFEVTPTNVTFKFINASDGAVLFNYTVLNTPPNIDINYTNNTNIASNITFTYLDNEYDTSKNCSLYVNNSLAYTRFDLTSNSSVVLNLSEDLGLLTGQQFKWYINCSDGALSNQTQFFTSTFGTSANTTNSSSSSSSGGGINIGQTKTKSQVWGKITPGSATIMKNFDKDLGIKEISIEVNNPVQNVKITVTKYAGKPAEVSVEKSGKVYKYLQIKTNNLENNLSKAVVNIQVEKAWLNSNGLNKTDIALFKFKDGNWQELTTTFSEEDITYYYYTIELTSFSYFAIGGKAAVGTPGETGETGETRNGGETTETTTGGEESKSKTWLWILIAVVILAVIIGGWLTIKNNK